MIAKTDLSTENAHRAAAALSLKSSSVNPEHKVTDPHCRLLVFLKEGFPSTSCLVKMT